MQYLFQRIIHNELQWRSPSIGRRGLKIDGPYIERHGFGHEDWQFSAEKAADGRLHGYMYFRPSDPNQNFQVAFATYDKGGLWCLAGFYRNAKFKDDGPTYPKAVLQRRAEQLLALKHTGDLGGSYNSTKESIFSQLRQETKDDYHWSVAENDVIRLAIPLPIPQNLLPPHPSFYFTRPCYLSKENFAELLSFSKTIWKAPAASNYSDGGEVEFPEGRKQQQSHIKRERSTKLVKLVKAQFKNKHGRLFCEACDFDFEKFYGQAGVGFIEAHHLIPVSKLKRGSKTKPSDMALVCSNCHRMLHKKRPWMQIEELRMTIAHRRPKH